MNIAEALNNATVFVDIKTGPSTTTYTLTGQRRAVEEKVGKRMVQYDPWGYGTRVTYNDHGAVVIRANSCE